MKRPKVSIELFVSLLVLAGLCPAAIAQVAAEAEAGASCAGSRWIGLKPRSLALCPSEGAWKGRALFAEVLASMPCELKKQAERLGLDDFCVYDPPWVEPAFDLAKDQVEVYGEPKGLQQPSLRLPADLTRSLRQLKQDCPVLAGAAEGEVSADAVRLEIHALEQAGMHAMPAAAGPRTWLTLVDTQPTQESPPFRESPAGRPVRSMHGYTLAHLADRLLCDPESPSSTCPVRIRTRLSMPMTAPVAGAGPARESLALAEVGGGGYYGRLGDLSVALVEEVAFWHRHRQPGERLVLNLSLGWEADNSDIGGDEARVRYMSGPVQSVYLALQLARQSGALVVAASGNRRAGGTSACQPPLLPAAWEVKPPAIGSPLGDWFRRCFTRWQRAPVRAAGAVQSEGFPLPNARPCSLPPRVAYGDHVVVETRGRERTAMLTGTSVGAAVISASAAAVWSLWPQLSADQVIDLLYRSGDRLDFAATLFEGGGPEPTRPAPQVRRVSLCRSVVRALAERPEGWGTVPPFACRDWDRHPPAGFVRIAPGEVVTSSQGEEDLAYCSSCSKLKPLPGGSNRLTRPQPEEDPCTTCTLTGGGGGHTRPAILLAGAVSEPHQLRIELKPEWRPAGWDGPCPVLGGLTLEIERFDAVDATLVVDRRVFGLLGSSAASCLDSLTLASVSIELGWESLDRVTARLRFLLRHPTNSDLSVLVESPVLVQREAPAVTDQTTSLDN